jgi:hypothetical protein
MSPPLRCAISSIDIAFAFATQLSIEFAPRPTNDGQTHFQCRAAVASDCRPLVQESMTADRRGLFTRRAAGRFPPPAEPSRLLTEPGMMGLGLQSNHRFEEWTPIRDHAQLHQVISPHAPKLKSEYHFDGAKSSLRRHAK